MKNKFEIKEGVTATGKVLYQLIRKEHKVIADFKNKKQAKKAMKLLNNA